MNYPRVFGRMRRNESGATAVEFAIVSGVFFMLMFGIIEYGMIMLTKVAIESAVIQVSRAASIGTVVTGCADRVCAVRKLVEDKTGGLIRKESVIVTASVISSPTTAAPPVPDICLANPATPYPAVCPNGAGFINNDSTAGYQPADASALSIGNAGELVEMRVTYLWRVLFPMFEIFQPQVDAGGQRGFLLITSTTVIKNEPF